MTTLLHSKIRTTPKGELYRVTVLLTDSSRAMVKMTRVINDEGFHQYFIETPRKERRKQRRAPNGALFALWELPARPILEELFGRAYKDATKGRAEDFRNYTKQLLKFVKQLEAMESRQKGLVKRQEKCTPLSESREVRRERLLAVRKHQKWDAERRTAVRRKLLETQAGKKLWKRG